MSSTNYLCKALSTILVFYFCSSAHCTELDEMSRARDEFNRTTSCVRGNLPMEIQFVLRDNPPQFTESSSIEEDVNNLAKAIGSTGASTEALLRDSAYAAWHAVQNYPLGSSQFSEELFKAFYVNLSANGPKRFHVDFCGEKNLVEDSVLENISAYFGRFLRRGKGGVDWGTKLPASVRDREGSILMLLTSLKLAGINVDSNLLISGFEKK